MTESRHSNSKGLDMLQVVKNAREVIKKKYLDLICDYEMDCVIVHWKRSFFKSSRYGFSFCKQGRRKLGDILDKGKEDEREVVYLITGKDHCYQGMKKIA